DGRGTRRERRAKVKAGGHKGAFFEEFDPGLESRAGAKQLQHFLGREIAAGRQVGDLDLGHGGSPKRGRTGAPGPWMPMASHRKGRNREKRQISRLSPALTHG